MQLICLMYILIEKQIYQVATIKEYFNLYPVIIIKSCYVDVVVSVNVRVNVPL